MLPPTVFGQILVGRRFAWPNQLASFLLNAQDSSDQPKRLSTNLKHTLFDLRSPIWGFEGSCTIDHGDTPRSPSMAYCFLTVSYTSYLNCHPSGRLELERGVSEPPSESGVWRSLTSALAHSVVQLAPHFDPVTPIASLLKFLS